MRRLLVILVGGFLTSYSVRCKCNWMRETRTPPARASLTLSLVAMIVTLMIVVTPARASATLRVPQDFPSIQAAVDAASSGDTIEVAPGTYTENLQIRKSVAVVAVTYDAANPVNNATILEGVSRNGAVITVARDLDPGPSFTGLVIRDGADGIFTRSPIVVRHSYLTGSVDGLNFASGAAGLVSDNVFEASRDDAIDINHPVKDYLIEDNEIRQSRGDGIEIRLHDDVIGDTADIVIRRNQIVQSQTDGVQLIDYFQDTNRRFVIEGNLIRGCGKAAIGLLDGGDSGEDFRAASIRERIHVFHNTFVDNDHGISGGDNLIALNNIFRGHQLALKNVDANSIVAHNLFWDNAVDQQGSVLDAPTTISADPLLDPNDRPSPGSPAIDSGIAFFEWHGEVVMDQPPSSYEGVAPDLGWYESSGAPNQPPTVDTVDVAPASPTTTDVITATVDATDPDDDALTFTYQWLLNGQDLSGRTSRTLDLAQGGNGDRGDALAVRVVASDGTASSPAVNSDEVTIVNAAPVFGQDLEDRTSAEGAAVSLSAGAADPDGDAVSYEATGLPPGLAIDDDTGLISGTIPTGAAVGGPYATVVTARDPSGAEATDTFTWTVVLAGTPVISGFDPASGAAGAQVTIIGSGFTGASEVLIDSTPASFTVDSDGQIIATVPTGAASGPITVTRPGGSATSAASFTVIPQLTVTVKDSKFVPKTVTSTQGQLVRWKFQGSSANTATDSIGLGAGTEPLFDSGPRNPGETYEFTFAAAGNYPYGSTLHPMTGTVKVPMTVSPTSGTTATEFTPRWATSAMPGYHFAVQYRFQPQGSSTWGKWRSLSAPQTAPSRAFVPDQGAGTYEFRSRLQNDATGRMSPFSVATSITVS